MEDIQQREDMVSFASCRGPFGCCMKEYRQGDQYEAAEILQGRVADLGWNQGHG